MIFNQIISMELRAKKDQVIRIETLLTAIDELPSIVFVIDEDDNIVYANKVFYSDTIKYVEDTVRISLVGSSQYRFSGNKMFIDVIVDEVIPLIKKSFLTNSSYYEHSVKAEVSFGTTKYLFLCKRLKIEFAEQEHYAGLLISGYAMMNEQIGFGVNRIPEAV